MSVLIRGMKMPSKCLDCELARLWGDCLQCTALEGFVSTHDYYKRMENCPLVEVKTHHGRLIDADLATKESMKRTGKRLLAIDTAPTVLEAEGVEDNG
jgi:hypothetical protein